MLSDHHRNWSVMWLAGVFFVISTTHATLYDAFTGKPATKDQLRRYAEVNTTSFCITDVKSPCDPNAYRRTDGSCNNLNNPPRGTIHTPSYRVLPPVYAEGYTNRKTKGNLDLKNPRFIRQQLLATGKGSSTKFTQLTLYFLLSMVNDITSLDDIVNYLSTRTYCCKKEGRKDDMCTPNLIRCDDPVHRFSNIRCMNLTRPFTFQFHKCLPNDTTPERIMPSTPLFDLSHIYNFIPDAISKLREYSGGRMRADIVNGREYPPGSCKDPIKKIPCMANVKPRETRCHAYHSNGVIGPNLYTIWIYRFHNYIAGELKKQNPCWNDDKLFYTAREIVIAFILQIFYYELLPLLLGRKNMIKEGLISCNKGFRDIYDEKVIPQMSDEFEYIMRWYHIAQENSMHMYDKDGHYLRSFPMVNLTTRTAYISEGDHEGEMLRGGYRQLGGGFFDSICDPGITDLGLGPAQKSFDITLADLAKGRLFGFAPYKSYREFCTKKKYNKWEDFCDAIDIERIYRLRIVYKDFEDVELIAGTWSEKQMKGTHVTATLYCLMVDQLLRNIKADRYWYERKDRPYAFTYEQLLQIRNANMAYFLCLVGYKVDKIQPQPFVKCGPKNRLVSCDEIKKMDLSPWKEC